MAGILTSIAFAAAVISTDADSKAHVSQMCSNSFYIYNPDQTPYCYDNLQDSQSFLLTNASAFNLIYNKNITTGRYLANIISRVRRDVSIHSGNAETEIDFQPISRKIDSLLDVGISTDTVPIMLFSYVRRAEAYAEAAQLLDKFVSSNGIDNGIYMLEIGRVRKMIEDMAIYAKVILDSMEKTD